MGDLRSRWRSLRRPWKVVIAGVGGWLVVNAIGLLVAWAHFATTDDFDTWVAAVPASVESVDAFVESEAVLAEDRPWGIGTLAPGLPVPEDVESIETLVTVLRGASWIAEVRVRCLVDRSSEASDAPEVPGLSGVRGLSIEQPVPVVKRGFKTLTVVHVEGLEDDNRNHGPLGPGIHIDVFVLAGQGEDRFKVATGLHTVHEEAFRDGRWNRWLALALPAWTILPFGGHPPDGWIVGASGEIWIRNGIVPVPRLGASTAEYSWAVRFEAETPGIKVKYFKSLQREFGGEVW